MSVSMMGNFLQEAKKFFEAVPEAATMAAVMAVNQVSERKAIPMLRKGAMEEVAFPAGYLDQKDRLFLNTKATKANPAAVITGRDRPTSLARFTRGQTPRNSRGKPITVTVKKGQSQTLKGAFLVSLSNGNMGLAIRLKQGRVPKRAYKPVLLDKYKNVYLLYGPSVDQVVKGVFDESRPEIGNDLSNEFFRQFTRLSRRG